MTLTEVAEIQDEAPGKPGGVGRGVQRRWGDRCSRQSKHVERMKV